MSSKWYTEQPTNRNFLAPVGFRMNLDLFAGVDFFCKSVNLPDISVPNAEIQTPYRRIPITSSGGLSYGDVRLTFLIDEDMKNYLTIYDWIIKNNLAEGYDTQKDPQYSDGQLEILNSNFQTNIIINYENLFPIDLSELSFDVEDREMEYFTASVTFKFTRYTFNNKNNQRI